MSQRSTRSNAIQRASSSTCQRASQSKRVDDSDSDDCSQATSSSKSKSIVRSSQSIGLSGDQIRSYTSDMVAYILANGAKNQTLRKETMVKQVIKDIPRAFTEIIEASKKQLLKTFGLDLIELPTHKGQYILVNKYTINDAFINSDMSSFGHSIKGLLLLILSIIFMNGNHISESDLWQALNKFGIVEEMSHDVFGNVQQLINKELVKQLYIIYVAVPNKQPPTFEYRWGPRAEAELNKLDVLEFASGIYETNPEQFREQYRDATQQDS